MGLGPPFLGSYRPTNPHDAIDGCLVMVVAGIVMVFAALVFYLVTT